MAERSRSAAEPAICLGCGVTTRRSSDRRNLYSSASAHILPLWSTTITSQLKKNTQLVDLDIDNLLSAEVGRPHLCRKCFYGYEKVLKVTSVIEDNANKAIAEVLSLPRSSSDSLPPPSKRRPQPLPQPLSTAGSPSVSVSAYLYDF